MIDITSRLGDLSNWSQGYITVSGSIDITGANRRALNSQYYASVAGCRDVQFMVSYNFPQGTSEGSGAICVCERDAKGSVVAYHENTIGVGEFPLPLDVRLNERTVYVEVAGRYLGSDYNGAVALLYDPPMVINADVNNGYPYNVLPEEVPTTKAMVQPYPDSWWRKEAGYNDGYPFNRLMPDIPRTAGAFEGAALERVRIPNSTKAIGELAFSGTALRHVRIAADATYSETSFPEGCIVTRYPDDRYEQVYDGQGRMVLDRDARRILMRRTDDNG